MTVHLDKDLGKENLIKTTFFLPPHGRVMLRLLAKLLASVARRYFEEYMTFINLTTDNFRN